MLARTIIVVAAIVVLATAVEAVNDPVGTFKIGTRYLDGTAFDPSTDILGLNESLYLNIYATETFYWGSSFGYFWALVCDPSLATITGGEIGPDADHLEFYGSPVDVLYGVPGNGQWGKIWSDSLTIYGDGLYMDNFLYSPQSVGDVTVSFWHIAEDLRPYGIIDSVVISQVPEPITIALLGLGALLLRSRRTCLR